MLEARGFPAVASTAGDHVFLADWAPHFERIKHVFVCFSRSAAGDAAAKEVQRVLPQARIARLPSEVGEGGTITSFFVELERTELDFEILLAQAASTEDDPADRPPEIREFRPVHRTLRRRAERLRNAVLLHEVVAQFITLHAAGKRLVGHCPLHNDDSSSFAIIRRRTPTAAASAARRATPSGSSWTRSR